jgi:glycerol-3-phosphate dehydrogenase
LFLNPQQGTTLLGTWYGPARAAEIPLACERGAGQLIDEMNAACPGLELSRSDVTQYQWGWLPLKAGRESGPPLGLAEQPVIVNHGSADGVPHLFSVEGVKYTGARAVAQRVVDEIVRDLGKPPAPCRTAVTMLDGAGMGEAPSESLDDLFVHRAIHQEMAVKLGDIIRRRGTRGLNPALSRRLLEKVARAAAAELGWTAQQQHVEVEEVLREYQLPTAAMEPDG